MTELGPYTGNSAEPIAPEQVSQMIHQESVPIVYQGEEQITRVTTDQLLAGLKADSQLHDPTSKPWQIHPGRRALDQLQADTDNARKYADPTRFTRARSAIARTALRQTQHDQQQQEAARKVVSLAEWSQKKAAAQHREEAIKSTTPPRSEPM